MSVTAITDKDGFDLKVLKAKQPTLVDFWAPWCGPCRALAPTIEELAFELSGKILVAKLDVDQNPRIAEKFEVFSIPTVILIKDGCEVDRIVGLCPKKQYTAVIEKQMT